MIKKLAIKNFKCFRDRAEFNFGQINLLTGINGRGKSSLLQSLLMFAQTGEKFINYNSLLLNGSFVDLGTFTDIKNIENPRNTPIEFEFSFDDDSTSVLSYSEDEDNPFQVISENDTVDFSKNDELSSLHYVSADRLGPVKYVEKIDLLGSPRVGKRGEFSLNVLHQHKNSNVYDTLYSGEDANTLSQQTEEWLTYILENTKINLHGEDPSSSVLSLLISNKTSSSYHKALNVGYGYSCMLPIIVTGLIAEEGDIIIIENPEAHLHPKAQSKLIEFLVKVSSCGIQVFIESHSEHILNGLRLCCLNDEIEIATEDVSILYFDNDFSIKTLELDCKAKISKWPAGFFDQQENDLAKLLKLSMEKK